MYVYLYYKAEYFKEVNFHEFHNSVVIRENFTHEMFTKKQLSLSVQDDM